MLDRFDVGMLSATRQRFVETSCDGRAHEATLSGNSSVVPLVTNSRAVRVEFRISFSGAKERHRCWKELEACEARTRQRGLSAAKASHSQRRESMEETKG